jgi:hypothetical protein
MITEQPEYEPEYDQPMRHPVNLPNPGGKPERKSKKPYPGVKLLKKLARERRMEEFRAKMETLTIKPGLV